MENDAINDSGNSETNNGEDSYKIGICSYHLCRKKTRVYKCKYCGDYFCEKHIKPKLPGMPRFKSIKPKDMVFMEEWRKDEGHPCIPYAEVWKKEQEEKEKEYSRVLDTLLERSYNPDIYEDDYEYEEDYENNYTDEENKPAYDEKENERDRDMDENNIKHNKDIEYKNSASTNNNSTDGNKKENQIVLDKNIEREHKAKQKKKEEDEVKDERKKGILDKILGNAVNKVKNIISNILNI